MGHTQPHGRGVVSDQMSVYLDWAIEQITDLFATLEILEQDCPSSPEALLKKIHDCAHNIKGLGGSFGYHLLTDVAGSLCLYIKNSPEEEYDTKVLRAHIDAFDMIIGEKISGSGGEPGRQLLTQLKEMG